METFDKLKQLFLTDPIDIGAQKLSSDEVVAIMNSSKQIKSESSDFPYARITASLVSKKPTKTIYLE